MFSRENFYYRQYFYKNRYMTLDVILNFDFGIISSAIFERFLRELITNESRKLKI